MKIIYSILFLTLIISACNNQAKEKESKQVVNKEQTQVSDNWVFDSVSGKELKFKNGKVFLTDVYELKYIGQLPNGSKSPFLIFSGRDCDECDAPISIFIHSPADGKLISQAGQNQYTHPGVESDYETNEPVYKARTFYGEVLPGIEGVIWYQEFLMDNHTWQKEIFLVKVNDGVKKESHLKNNKDIKETLEQFSKNLCKEIKGMDYLSQP